MEFDCAIDLAPTEPWRPDTDPNAQNEIAHVAGDRSRYGTESMRDRDGLGVLRLHLFSVVVRIT